jgi:hypothetical protein
MAERKGRSQGVSAAVAEQAARERRLAAARDAIAAYEAEFGEITVEEIAEREPKDRRAAIVIRGRPKNPRKARRGAG